MAARGWSQAREWADHANALAPTIVGGSTRRGGADLGPTRSKRAWARQWVDGSSIGDQVPDPDWTMTGDFDNDVWKGYPKLTVEQAALLQGFPSSWRFAGKKTARYRQVAQASPPSVAEAMGRSIVAALNGTGALNARAITLEESTQPPLF